MTRRRRSSRVFFVEEPIADGRGYDLQTTVADGVTVVTPRIPARARRDTATRRQRELLRAFFDAQAVVDPVLWFYTPMMWPLVDGFTGAVVVYDCMDELSGFAGAPAELVEMERVLLARADVVFTGGHALYEAKRGLHANIHPMPSGVDVAHFATARQAQAKPDDQRAIARPRIGFAGVIDERMNLSLLAEISALRPSWNFVLLGPVVKIDPETLPRAANLHYLGMKPYADLPRYFAGWDAAMMPFAHNAATRFISPTKTPEYLAAGCPVVSTSIRDVVRPYGEQGCVEIADDAPGFVAALERAISPAGRACVAAAAPLLAAMSWDRRWQAMEAMIATAGRARRTRRPEAIAGGLPCSTI